MLIRELFGLGKKKIDWNQLAKELFAKGKNEEQITQELIKQGCPPKQAAVYVQAAQMDGQSAQPKVKESATAGATSAGSIATVISPHIAIGKDRGKKSYIGDPWGGKSGTKAPKTPKAVQPKNADGTAKNALDMKGNIFGSPQRR